MVVVDEPLTRPRSEYEDLGKEKYEFKDVSFNVQYVHLYKIRLAALQPLVEKTLKSVCDANEKENGSSVPIISVSQIRPGVRVAVIGTIQKRQTLKPSILKEVSEEHNLEPIAHRDNYTDESDELFVEDDTQSFALSGDVIKPEMYCNGLVVGLIGAEDSDGQFCVESVHYPSLDPPRELPPLEDDRYLLIVSGLNLGDAAVEQAYLEILSEFITGDLGPIDISKKIVRMIVAGNGLGAVAKDRSLYNQARYLSRKAVVPSVMPLKQLDGFLQQMCASCDVDVMPGDNDPGTAFMPQQPLHKCMFPLSSRFSTFSTVSNPYECAIDGVHVAGCSGQNVTDIKKFTALTDDIEILKLTLKSGIICPTAPDTLPCYPFSKTRTDPFVLSKQPNVYFSANCKAFRSEKNDHNQLLLCIPEFSSTLELVAVNLKNLEVMPINLSHNLPGV